MHILVLSDSEMATEFKLKFSVNANRNSFSFLLADEIAKESVKSADVIFDFRLQQQPDALQNYAPHQVVFCNAVALQLAAFVNKAGHEVLCTVFGFNGLPSLFNREVLEVSMLRESDSEKLQEVCEQLGTEYLLVEDRVGMVTPRILCMIINEACYTLQEKTADVAAIDLGMKLGTNYPKGPFEWANKIGIAHVYKVLEALYEDTREERYKICPLLKTKYLKGQSFEV